MIRLTPTARLVKYLNGRTQRTKKIVLLVIGACVACYSFRLILVSTTSENGLIQPGSMIQPPLQQQPDSTHSQQLNKTDSL